MVPLDGSASYEEISKASGLAAPMVYRFIRMGMTNNMFDEDSSGRVVHTAITRLLVTDPDFADAIGMQIEELAPSGSRFIEAMEKFGQDAQEPNQNAFALLNDTDKGTYGFFGQHPERARRFGAAMRFYTHGSSWGLRHILNAFDFSSLDYPGALIVDVAGGHGQVSQYLARHTKNTRFLVQDLPHVAEAGSKELPSDLKSRVEFEGHNFLEPQALSSPPTAFLLRWILHNWPEKYCVQILQSLIPAMEKGTKLFIYEYVLDDGPVKGSSRKHSL